MCGSGSGCCTFAQRDESGEGWIIEHSGRKAEPIAIPVLVRYTLQFSLRLFLLDTLPADEMN